MMSEEQLLQRIADAESRVQGLMQNRHAEYPSSIRGIAEYMTLREVYGDIQTEMISVSTKPNFAKQNAACDYLAKVIAAHHNKTKSTESAALYNKMFDSNGLLLYSTAIASNDEVQVNEALRVMENLHYKMTQGGKV